MKSTRTLITISDQDKNWLVSYAQSRGISIAEAVRQAIARMISMEREQTYEQLANAVRGSWEKGDGLEYQQKIRAEWEGATND
jgi:hypothetical protein